MATYMVGCGVMIKTSMSLSLQLFLAMNCSHCLPCKRVLVSPFLIWMLYVHPRHETTHASRALTHWTLAEMCMVQSVILKAQNINFYLTLEQEEEESVWGRGLFYYHALAVTLLQTNNEWASTKDPAYFTFTLAYTTCHILLIKVKEVEIRKCAYIRIN